MSKRLEDRGKSGAADGGKAILTGRGEPGPAKPVGAGESLRTAEAGAKPATPGMARKPTLRTVAEMTGYAVTTVSKALAGDPKIAEKTRAKVEAAATRVGYVPDRAAQRLRTGRTNVIALVLDPHSEILGFSGSMITGIAAALGGTRYHISIMQHELDDDPMVPIRHILRNRLADGVVFARTKFDDPRVRLLMEHGFPFVSHGRTEQNGEHAFLDYDNDAFACEAVRRLARAGRKRICIIPPAPQYTFSRHMRDGFERGIRAAGVASELPPAGIDLNTSAERLYGWFAKRLAQPDPPDGIICPGEIAAVAVQAAVSDSGLVLGRDVGLLAKQTSRLFDLYRPRIDSIYEDIRASGFEIGKLLLRHIAGEPPETLQKVMAPATEL